MASFLTVTLFCLLVSLGLTWYSVLAELRLRAMRERLLHIETNMAEARRLDRADRHIEGIQRISRNAYGFGKGVARSVRHGLEKFSSKNKTPLVSEAIQSSHPIEFAHTETSADEGLVLTAEGIDSAAIDRPDSQEKIGETERIAAQKISAEPKVGN